MNSSDRSSQLCPQDAPSEVDARVMEGILNASSDACWCMEFAEPVDLTAPESEIVRQVFENGPFWRFTNAAMARLYVLPPDVNFNARPTSEIFPRNPRNEEFVLRLIANGFEMDAGPALDTRYDGVQIYVENDVRAHIVDGYLVRMFGIVRDVGKHRYREEAMKAELREAAELFGSLPLGVLGFDRDGEVAIANPMACRLLGMSVDALQHGHLLSLEDFAPVFEAIRRVGSTSIATRLIARGIDWSLAPRDGGGVIACLQSVRVAESA